MPACLIHESTVPIYGVTVALRRTHALIGLPNLNPDGMPPEAMHYSNAPMHCVTVALRPVHTCTDLYPNLIHE